MRNFFLVRWLRDVSIARKLYFTVGLMALLIAMELFTLQFAIRTLSSVRALVGAEGLWSKAQKDAAYSLQKYGRTHNEADYADYLNALKVPLGDRKTRLELIKATPDMDEARRGFLEGRNHPSDVDGAIKIFLRFGWVSYIQDAARVWTKGDSLIDGMIAIGNRLHAEVTSPARSPEKINAILMAMDPLNAELTKLEDEFSFILGEGSRWLAGLILKLLLTLVLTVEICGLTITILVSRGISRGLNAIIGSSERIAKGDYTARAEVYSNDEIGVLATSFNEMTKKLEHNIHALEESKEELRVSKELAEQSVVIKSNFLANMSHEIRTPMNAVLGFTKLLQTTELDEQQKEFVQAINVSGQNLMTIINDILSYSRIESGKIVIEQIPFSVREIFDSLKVLLHPKVIDKNLDIRFYLDEEIPQTVVGDPTRLMQILLNIADNAIKFTEKGRVKISAAIQHQNNERVAIEFRIVDTGIGISPDKRAVIFERFTQESAEMTRRYGGTGLGLSIAKNLVELQNGIIAVNSEVGVGSEFMFSITYGKVAGQVEKKAEQKPVAEPAQSSNGTALKILLAEDNKVNQSLAVHVLKRFGFSTDVAENGRIALDMLQQGSYDLILMDMQMPEMDGYEATTIIRTQLSNDIPIIALTAHALGEEREKCLALGMNEYVSKPFKPEELHEKILQVTNGRA
jgi:signal transduction histidine kinase/CheY-like chemotaxis protein